MATHSSALFWRIPGTGEPAGLSSMGSHRIGHDRNDLAVAVSCLVVSCNPMDYSPPGSSVHGIPQNTGVHCHFFLQEVFPTQELNLGLLH